MVPVHGAGRSHGQASGDAGEAVTEGHKDRGQLPVPFRRRLIDGIRFRVRTGVPWRDVPVECGPWGRVHAVPSPGDTNNRPSRGPSANGGDHSGSALHADQLIPLVP
ncbi:transposase [Streptomyces sp. NPDC057699]|uniref:transposase n=1 Tax=Streptomyces sp. NPDC057699 TaxID=3346220 RepID=UPI0036822125